MTGWSVATTTGLVAQDIEIPQKHKIIRLKTKIIFSFMISSLIP
jgi:hypothetical protein